MYTPTYKTSRGKNTRARIFKVLRSSGIDSKESIPPTYVASQAGTTNLFLLGS
jgi:hypothetical protein